MALAANHHAEARVEASGLGVAGVGPRFDLVDEQAFDVADELAGEPLAFGHKELADDKAVLEQAAFFFDAPPDAIMLVVSVPSTPDGGAVRFAEVENFVAAGMEDRVEGQAVAPSVSPTAGFVVHVTPIEDESIVVHTFLMSA